MTSSMKATEEDIPYKSKKNRDYLYTSLESKELPKFKNFFYPNLNNLNNIPIGKNLNKIDKKNQLKNSKNDSTLNISNWMSTIKNNDSKRNKSFNVINYLNTNINKESNFIAAENDAIETIQNSNKELILKEKHKNILKLKKANAFILHTESTYNQQNKDYNALENSDFLNTKYLNSYRNNTKSDKNINKKSFNFTPKLFQVPEENIVSLSKLLVKVGINNEKKKKNESSNLKTDYNSLTNDNFNYDGAHTSLRSISEIPKIKTLRSTFNLNNNHNIVHCNNDNFIKKTNFNKINLLKDFRKASFLNFSDGLKLNKNKNISLMGQTSKNLLKNSFDKSKLMTINDKCLQENEKKEKETNLNTTKKNNFKKQTLLEPIDTKLTSPLNKININKFSKSNPKIKLGINKFPYENEIESKYKTNNNNNLNKDLLNLMPNLANKSIFQRNIIKEEAAEKNTYTESFNKKDYFVSHTASKNVEESFEKSRKEKHELAINSFLNKFETQKQSIDSDEENYFHPQDDDNKKGIFGFNSNFDNFGNLKSKKNHIPKINYNLNNKQKSLFDIYTNKNDENNISNLIPKSNHFIALDKSNSFKYFANFIRKNTDKNDNNQNQAEEKNEVENYLRRTKNPFGTKTNIDIRFNVNDKNFYKDEFMFSYSNCFSPTSFYKNTETNNFPNNTSDNIYAENPTDFETDLKKKTIEFSKTSKMKFYQTKTSSFKKLEEFNKKKIKNFLIDEYKNNELIEKIEKSKEPKSQKLELPYNDIREVNRHCFHGFRKNATNKFMKFIINKEEKINESKNQSSNEELFPNEKTNLFNYENSDFSSNKIFNFQQQQQQPNKIKLNEMRRDSFICTKPLKCYSDGRTHSLSEIFERRQTQKFRSLKVNAESMRNCLLAIAEENKKELNENKIKAFYDKLKKKEEFEVPEMHYLSKVNKRLNNIVKKQAK